MYIYSPIASSVTPKMHRKSTTLQPKEPETKISNTVSKDTILFGSANDKAKEIIADRIDNEDENLRRYMDQHYEKQKRKADRPYLEFTKEGTWIQHDVGPKEQASDSSKKSLPIRSSK